MPKSWNEYKEAIKRPKRWIDGILLFAAAEVLKKRITVVLCTKNNGQVQWVAQPAIVPTGKAAPVSYTHLTLPTICSV
eukprot:9115821-Alexandrium_andersonii.AAC.1